MVLSTHVLVGLVFRLLQELGLTSPHKASLLYASLATSSYWRVVDTRGALLVASRCARGVRTEPVYRIWQSAGDRPSWITTINRHAGEGSK
jgi:hypothetical protein